MLRGKLTACVPSNYACKVLLFFIIDQADFFELRGYLHPEHLI